MRETTDRPGFSTLGLLMERTAGVESLLANVARDLQEPLRALDGCSQALQRRHADRLNEEGKRMLHMVSSELSRTSHLLEGLLTFSRVGTEPLECERVDMGALATRVCHTVATVTRRQVEFRVGTLPEARGDNALLRHVFFNLLSNAVKFTAESPHPVIEIGGERGAQLCQYWVKDNGIGFDPDEAKRLFGAFQRLHDPALYDGTGLGLAIVERIVRRHGGKVRAQGTPGQGATFYFTVPSAGSQVL